MQWFVKQLFKLQFILSNFKINENVVLYFNNSILTCQNVRLLHQENTPHHPTPYRQLNHHVLFLFCLAKTATQAPSSQIDFHTPSSLRNYHGFYRQIFIHKIQFKCTFSNTAVVCKNVNNRSMSYRFCYLYWRKKLAVYVT